MTTEQTGFFHSVFFWLREGSDPNAAALVIEGCRTLLAGIPSVLRLTVGRPAGVEYPPVDNSFDVALLIEFQDHSAHHAYEVHPDHLRFVAECGPYLSRTLAYDVVSAEA